MKGSIPSLELRDALLAALLLTREGGFRSSRPVPRCRDLPYLKLMELPQPNSSLQHQLGSGKRTMVDDIVSL